jgi:hypothetical protein
MIGKEPRPCKKFSNADAARFVRHASEDKCPKCLAVIRYLQREHEIDEELWKRRN